MRPENIEHLADQDLTDIWACVMRHMKALDDELIEMTRNGNVHAETGRLDVTMHISYMGDPAWVVFMEDTWPEIHKVVKPDNG